MSTYIEIYQDILSFQNEKLEATLYKPTDIEMKTVLLYFHGGGFVFGSRMDLPTPYLEHLTSAGIGIMAVDYPLAPETKFPVLIETTNKVTEWFVEQFLPAHNLKDYFILGRSAGGFLALSNAVYAEQLSTHPTGIISLYGYYQLHDASFTVPNRHYLQYPKVNDKIVAKQIKKAPIFQSTDQNRYLLYMAARQKGNWLNTFLEDPKQKSDFSLTKEAVKDLPPLFLASSTKDPDVPTRQSRQMANMHPKATLHLVDVEEHDFDRTHVDTLGMDLYEEITAWILNLIK